MNSYYRQFDEEGHATLIIGLLGNFTGRLVEASLMELNGVDGGYYVKLEYQLASHEKTRRVAFSSEDADANYRDALKLLEQLWEQIEETGNRGD